MRKHEIIKALTCLTDAADSLKICQLQLRTGMFDYHFGEAVHNAWLRVNAARVVTQESDDLEEQAIPCLGYLNDGACMYDSIIAWKCGFTYYAQRSILTALQNGAELLIGMIRQLEGWLDDPRLDSLETDECFERSVVF